MSVETLYKLLNSSCALMTTDNHSISMIANTILKRQLLVVLLLWTGLLASAQKGYTYILAEGDTVTSKQFALNIKDRRIQHFVVNNQKIEPYSVKYFYKGNNYFKIERINEKVKRNIFKRYQEGERIDLYYKSGFVIENSITPEKVTKKQFYYEKDNGFLREFKYESLWLDLNGNDESEQILKKVEKMKKIRRIALGVASGVLIYQGLRLNSEKSFDALVTIPLALFTFVINSSNKEERLLRKAALSYR